jgi:hypothetical protein
LKKENTIKIKKLNVMNLKKLLLSLTFVVIAGLSVNAQERDSANCAKYKSLYYEYLRQGMYRDAMNFWQMAYNYCGGSEYADSRLLGNGRVGYLKLMEIEKDSVKRLPLRDSVYWIYEGLLVKDPANADWSGKYAVMLSNENDKRFDKIDSLYRHSIYTMKCDVPASYIRGYFRHLIVNRYNAAPADKKDAIRDYIISEYMQLSEFLSCGAKNKRAAGAEDEAKKYDAEQDFIDKYFLQIVKDCETLTMVVEKNLASLPQDKDQKSAKVKSYIALLDKKKCESTPTYGKLLDTLLTIDPSAEAYSITGDFYLKQESDSKAIEYYEKAVELEGAGANKDKYNFKLASAQYKAGRYSAAFRTAKLVEGEYKGKAMMICGNAIAATANGCGDSTFDRKANFWLANDYYKKAAALGETDASTSKFLSSAPTEAEIFEANKTKGNQHYCTCWGESTTIR